MFAEQAASAAQLKVAARNFVAAAEISRLADGLQSFVGNLAQHHATWVKEKRIRLLSGPPDTPAQLVQLPEAETLGVFNNERVYRRHVDAALDDGGAYQDVESAFPKIDDGLLEHEFVHLTVCIGDARLGHKST